MVVLMIEMVQKMTKQEMILQLAETQVEGMEQIDILILATQMVARDLAKLSAAEIRDQYEYAFGTTE